MTQAGDAASAGAARTAAAGAASAPVASARLAIGLGCDRGTPETTVEACLREPLAQAGAQIAQVAVAASIEAKHDEAAFLSLAARHGWPLRWYAAAQLAAVRVPNPSETVLRYMGTPSVSEAAALLAAGAADASALLVEKHRLRGADGRHATVSIARIPQAPQGTSDSGG